MGVVLRYFLFFTVIFSVSIQAFGQDWPKETIRGKEYYIHYVAPGNTLYAISKKYAVSISDLLTANPNSQEGLGIGDRILVPVDAVDKKSLKKQNITIQGESLLHTVQKKETLFSISKKYGIDLNDLTAANPDAIQTLRTGSILRIPVINSIQTDSVFLAPAVSDTFMVHQVQPGDTPYNLSKYYEIPLDSLTKANKDFIEGLKTGSWIVIPKYTEAFLSAQEMLSEARSSESTSYPGGLAEKYNLGFMLPFEVMVNDSLEKSLKLG